MDVLEVMKRRLAEAEEDAGRLRQAIAQLEGSNGAAARPQRTRRAKAAESKPVIPLGKVVSELRKHDDGVGTAALAQKLGGSQSQILTLLKEAEGEQVRRQGSRGQTRWLVMTDEEKVAKRASEITARSKATRRAKAA